MRVVMAPVSRCSRAVVMVMMAVMGAVSVSIALVTCMAGTALAVVTASMMPPPGGRAAVGRCCVALGCWVAHLVGRCAGCVELLRHGRAPVWLVACWATR